MEKIVHPVCPTYSKQVQARSINNYTSNFTMNEDLFNAKHHINVECYPIFHTQAEIIIVLSGVVEATIGDKVYNIGEKQAAFLIPYETHSYRTEKGSESIVIKFQPSLVQHFDNIIGSTDIANPVFNTDETTYNYAKERLLSSVDKFTKLEAQALIYAVLAVFLKFQNTNKLNEKKNYSIINEILLYIENNCAEELTLSVLANQFGMSAQCISRMLKAHLGISFTNYISNVRLTKSLELLKYSDKSISEIAYECGFGSVRNYNRAFSDYMKKTPSEFRRDRNEYHSV